MYTQQNECSTDIKRNWENETKMDHRGHATPATEDASERSYREHVDITEEHAHY